MVEYSKVNVKFSDRQLKQHKTAFKNKTGTTLRMSLKMLDGIIIDNKIKNKAKKSI